MLNTVSNFLLWLRFGIGTEKCTMRNFLDTHFMIFLMGEENDKFKMLFFFLKLSFDKLKLINC